MLAERLIWVRSPLDRGHTTSGRLALLGQPIHVVSFDVVGAAWVTAVLLAGLISIWLIARQAFVVERGRTMRSLLIVQGIAGFMLALSPVTFSPDPTSYVLFGRLYGVFGLNPYTPPVQLPYDGILRTVAPFWGPRTAADCYGPLWTLLAAALAHLQAHASLAPQWIAQRLLAVGGGIAVTLGLFRLLRRRMEETEIVSRLAQFAFHPFVLLETAVNGHNDVLMLACAVWAFALVEEAPLLAGALLGASIAVKFVSIVAVPFFAVMLLRAHRSPKIALGAGAAASALVVLPFVPFWAGARTFEGLLAQGNGVISPAFLLHEWVPEVRVMWAARVLLALWVIAAAVLFRRFLRGADRSDGYWAVTLFLWASPLVGAYYFMWLSPIAVERGAWGVYVRRLLNVGVLYYVLGLFPLLSLHQAAALYFVIALLWPLAKAPRLVKTPCRC